MPELTQAIAAAHDRVAALNAAGHDTAAAAAQERLERLAAEMLADILDECVRLVQRFVCCTYNQAVTMVLIAAQTHVLDVLVTTCRALWWSEYPESGKTVAMMVTASLCNNPTDTTGTSYALQSALAAAGTAGNPAPTLFRDEISSVFGTSGLTGRNNPLADIIRKGYKAGATSMWSVNRMPDNFSIFSTFLMAGLRTAVPTDIRSRCIVFRMEPGVPVAYFDVREGEADARDLARALASACRGCADQIGAFRARSLHEPQLTARKLEVWEPLLAVASAACPKDADGNITDPTWLNRAVTAFRDLGIDSSVNLSPEQITIRDLAEAVATMDLFEWQGQPFAAGADLRDELRHMNPERYAARTDAAVGCMIRDALQAQHIGSIRQRVTDENGDEYLLRGYPADVITEVWDRIRPNDQADVAIHEDPDPFGDDEVVVPDVPGSVPGQV